MVLATTSTAEMLQCLCMQLFQSKEVSCHYQKETGDHVIWDRMLEVCVTGQRNGRDYPCQPVLGLSLTLIQYIQHMSKPPLTPYRHSYNRKFTYS